MWISPKSDRRARGGRPGPRPGLRPLLLALALYPAAAPAETVSYAPETCSTDAQGQVYVRVTSGLAFAFPIDDLLDLGRREPGPFGDEVPGEPEGCPGNPIRADAPAVVYRPVAPPAEGEPAEARWRPESLRIFGHDGPTTVQRGNLEVFSKLCLGPQQTGRVTTLPSGLSDCRFPLSRAPEHPSMWHGYVAAPPGLHVEHGGLTFIVRCGMASHPKGSRGCTTDYQMTDGLSVAYGFRDNLIPPDRMLAFDRLIRAFVEARRRPDLDAPHRREGGDDPSSR